MIANALRVDWFRVIADLARAGYTARRIATELGVSRIRVVGWKNAGHEPRYTDGSRLLALWAQATGRRVDDVPLVRAALSAAALRR